MQAFSHDTTEYYGHVDMTYERNGVCDYPYDYVGEFQRDDSQGRGLFYPTLTIEDPSRFTLS